MVQKVVIFVSGKRMLIVVVFTLFVSLGVLTVYSQKVVRLNDCPTTDSHLSVTVSEDFMSATIRRDGKVIQTVTDEEFGLVSYGEVAPVHFLDANFDGFTDIFIGVGESRTYSTLLLWNNKKQQFVRVGEAGNPDLQGFMLYPTGKKVIEGGSGSYCSFYITQSHWEGYQLVRDEQLVIITEKSEYSSYEVKNKYTVFDANQKASCSTESFESLPKNWQQIVRQYGF